MAEILSQQEIDSLLSDIESGEDVAVVDTAAPAARQISVYDFRHPNLVSKEQIRVLEMVYSRFAKLVESYLTSKIRKLVDVKLMAVDQVTYSEFMLSVSDPSCLYTLKIENLRGEAILEVSLPLVFYLIDRLFGGEGNTIDNVREMTHIEQFVIKKVANNIVTSLSKAWAEVHPMNIIVSGYQSRPSYTQIASLEEMVISISLEVNVQEVSGFVNLCFPFRLLEDALPKNSTEEYDYFRKSQKSPEDRRFISKSLRTATAPVSVELGRKEVTVGELLELQEGDVIRLDSSIEGDLVIYVEELAKFMGAPGITGSKLAVKITETL